MNHSGRIVREAEPCLFFKTKRESVLSSERKKKKKLADVLNKSRTPDRERCSKTFVSYTPLTERYTVEPQRGASEDWHSL